MARVSIVQELRTIQDKYGYLPLAQLKELADLLQTPRHRIQEVAGTFPSFRSDAEGAPPRLQVHVCRDMACFLRSAPEVLRRLTPLVDEFGAEELSIEGVSCLGRCDRAPAVRLTCFVGGKNPKIHEYNYLNRTPEQVVQIVRTTLNSGELIEGDSDEEYQPNGSDEKRRIDPYADAPLERDRRYQAVARFIQAHPTPPEAVVNQPMVAASGRQPNLPSRASVLLGVSSEAAPREKPAALKRATLSTREKEEYRAFDHFHLLSALRLASLLGMGGAGVPVYQKWLEVFLESSEEKYIVCNGDESEPTTFKDREILLRSPHLVVEGMILAGLLVGAEQGYVFIRHEYPEQAAAVRREIERAKAWRYCGEGILGTKRTFNLEVFVSPGGYICGEQSALLEAIEDRRAEPRNRPPDIRTNGLFDKPTVVNNVESFAWVPSIALEGGSEYRNQGSEYGRGRRLLSICGDVERPGVYEVPIGTTFGALLDKCGGVKGGKKLLALAPSGPSGGLLPARLPAADGAKAVADAVKRARTDLAKLEQEEKDAREDVQAANESLVQVRGRKQNYSLAESAVALDVYADEQVDEEELTKADLADLEARATTKHAAVSGKRAELAMLERFQKKAFAGGEPTWDVRDLPLDLGLFRSLRLMLGAGMLVAAEGADLVGLAANAVEFFRNESCGKCVPCRLGSQQIAHVACGLRDGRFAAAEFWQQDGSSVGGSKEALVKGLSVVMERTSICGLGSVAFMPLTTLMSNFPAEVNARLH